MGEKAERPDTQEKNPAARKAGSAAAASGAWAQMQPKRVA